MVFEPFKNAIKKGQSTVQRFLSILWSAFANYIEMGKCRNRNGSICTAQRDGPVKSNSMLHWIPVNNTASTIAFGST